MRGSGCSRSSGGLAPDGVNSALRAVTEQWTDEESESALVRWCCDHNISIHYVLCGDIKAQLVALRYFGAPLTAGCAPMIEDLVALA